MVVSNNFVRYVAIFCFQNIAPFINADFLQSIFAQQFEVKPSTGVFFKKKKLGFCKVCSGISKSEAVMLLLKIKTDKDSLSLQQVLKNIEIPNRER